MIRTTLATLALIAAAGVAHAQMQAPSTPGGRAMDSMPGGTSNPSTGLPKTLVQRVGGRGCGQVGDRAARLYRRQEPDPRYGRQLGRQGDARQRRSRRGPRAERHHQGAVGRKVFATRPGGTVTPRLRPASAAGFSYLCMDLCAASELQYPEHAHSPYPRSRLRDRGRHAGLGAVCAGLDRQRRTHAGNHVARRPAAAADDVRLRRPLRAFGVVWQSLPQYRNAIRATASNCRATRSSGSRRRTTARGRPRPAAMPCRRGRRACRARSRSSPMAGSSRSASR